MRATLPTTHEADATLTVEASIKAELELIPSGSTSQQRFERIRVELAKLNYLTSQQESRFRAQIDEAIAAELETFGANADAVRLRDIYPVLGGITLSIAAYIVPTSQSLKPGMGIDDIEREAIRDEGYGPDDPAVVAAFLIFSYLTHV